MTNALSGAYDVVLTDPGGAAVSAIQAITIEPALPQAVSTSMAGNQTPRAGQPTEFSCAVRNTANVDAPYVVIHAAVEGATPWSLRRPANTFPRNCIACNPDPLSFRY